MSLEDNISKTIQKQLEGDLIERVIAEQLEACIKKTVNSLLGDWGDCKKIIEEKLKSVMIPQLEQYDYSEHVVKLDNVLTEILKVTTLDNKKILENFKDFMGPEEMPKTIKVSELYEKYMEYVADNVDTDDLEVEYDDEPTYEDVETDLEIKKEEGRSWSSFEGAKLFMECTKKCENESEFNIELSLSRWKKDEEDAWDIDYDKQLNLTSLRQINEFEIYLLKLVQNRTKIIIDTWSEHDDVTPTKEPEVDYY